jgi:hypothetical protein
MELGYPTRSQFSNEWELGAEYVIPVFLGALAVGFHFVGLEHPSVPAHLPSGFRCSRYRHFTTRPVLPRVKVNGAGA